MDQATLLVILREIELECYKQIAIEQRDGRAIEEKELDDIPEWDSFEFHTPTNLSANDNKLSAPQNVAQLPTQTLADLINASDDNQMTLDDLINTSKDSATSDTPPAMPAAPTEEADEDKKQESSRKKQPSVLDKIKAFLAARKDWHVEKSRVDYSYECSKQKVKDRIYGFEHMADFIEKYIKRLSRIDNSGNDDNYDNIHPV